MKKYAIELTFLRDVLGSQPSDKDIKRTYIANKLQTGRTGVSAEIAMNKINEEIENLELDEDFVKRTDEIEDKTLTVFFRNKEGKPSLSDIQFRGYIKDQFAFIGKAEGFLKKKSGEGYSGDDKFKKWIGDRIMFADQYYPLEDNTEIDIYTRPLKVLTARGPRVTLSSSERVKAPFKTKFVLCTTDDLPRDMIIKVLDRGLWKGIGQMANHQFGTFTYTIKDE
jgi:hypothetical protein